MRRSLPSRAFLLAGLALLSGCMNASSLQTARVVPRGEDRVSVGFGTTHITNTDFRLPYGEVMYRYGIWENVDVGAHVTLLGTSAIDAKVQLMADDRFALSSGLKFGTLEITSTVPDPNDPSRSIELKSGVAQLIVPVYVSYDVGTHLTLYGSPKYLLNATMGSDQTAITHFAGTTLGVQLGDSWGLLVEATALYGFSTSNLQLQGNAAIFWTPRWL